MGNVPWDATGMNCYGMGMGQINMSNGQPWEFDNIIILCVSYNNQWLVTRSLLNGCVRPNTCSLSIR